MKETQVNPGFLLVDDIGLEPTTPTMSTCVRDTAFAGKQQGNSDTRERLHQCLHQIGELIKGDGLESLADVLAESLDPNVLERLSNALSRRVTRK